jgi:integrase
VAEVGKFREAMRDHRLFACWLLSCYGLRRSEVLGLRWSAVDLDSGIAGYQKLTWKVAQSRVSRRR